MPRARSLKPGFFKNELLAEIDPLGRLLFEGMWCEADREGRLEDRPKRLKAEYLPYDDCDPDKLIQLLADRDFIIRYEVNGIHYIQVTNFARHQNPHKAEKPSKIPSPHSASNGQEPYEHGVSTVQKQCLNDENTEPVGLTPDSLSLDNPPIVPPSGGPEPKRSSGKGWRLPEDWILPDVLREWATENTPGIDPSREAEKFRDYWRSQPGSKGRKSDWHATWRNWCRRAEEMQAPKQPQPPQRRRRSLAEQMGET